VAVTLLSWMPKYLYDGFHMSLATAGLAATAFVQLASMAAAPLGGWLADSLRKRTPAGRMIVQAAGVLCGAPFVAWCGLTRSVTSLIVALTAWGVCKGIYDANIFASLFDVIARKRADAAAGVMNSGWIGGGLAPVTIGYLAWKANLGLAIAAAALAYVTGGAFLLVEIFFFVRRERRAPALTPGRRASRIIVRAFRRR